MLKLRSSVAAWIFVLELDSLDLNRKTKSLSSFPPLLSLKPPDYTVKDFVLFVCFILLMYEFTKKTNGLVTDLF